MSGRSVAGSGAADHFDLFPYIGLLICLLGALLLTTLGIATLSLGPSAAETWELAAHAGAPAAKQPVLVEWDGKDAIVHDGEQRRRVPGLRGAADEITAAMRELIAEFRADRSRRYPLFAVRPSGFGTFRALAQAFRRAEVDIGYEPIGQDRPVRLGTAARGAP
jgi:hypothetical protein